MNSIILFNLLLVSCHISLAKKDVSSLILFPDQSNNSCQSQGLQCKDCETIQLCSSNLEPIFQTKCGDQSKSRPFCDSETNSCVKSKPVICNIQQYSFACPDVGTYPDLENCKNYYVCDENKNPQSFPCSAGFIYDHAIKGCTPGLFCRSYSTKTGQCKGKINKLIEYAPSKELYILCLSGRPSLLFQCPIKGHTFNEEELTCKFECTKTGFFPNYDDPTKFYSCVQSGKKIVQYLLNCPAGTEFVQLGDGQGICSIKTTTSTTTETVATTTQQEEENNNIDEGSGEAEITNNNNVPESKENNVVPNAEIENEGFLYNRNSNENILNDSSDNSGSNEGSLSTEDKKR